MYSNFQMKYLLVVAIDSVPLRHLPSLVLVLHLQMMSLTFMLNTTSPDHLSPKFSTRSSSYSTIAGATFFTLIPIISFHQQISNTTQMPSMKPVPCCKAFRVSLIVSYALCADPPNINVRHTTVTNGFTVSNIKL